jgi:simple sugar transport system permease protein
MKVSVRAIPRYDTPRWLPVAALAGSVAAGLAAAGVMFAVSGVDPLYAIGRIFGGSFGSLYGLGETVTKAIPLILIASGLAVAFRARFWNIGAESQLLLGATLAGWVGLYGRLPAPLLVPAMFAAGFAGGALWGLVPAALRVRFGVNEVISTLMLNYIASELMTLLVTGPWKGATQHGFPYTDDLAGPAVLWVVPGTRIHVVTLVVAVAATGLLHLLVHRSRFGYELRVIGENREAARYAGIDLGRTTLVMMLVSGGVAGLAGVGEVAGVHHHLTYPNAISSGYGYAAIIVAWLGRLNPLGAVLAGFLFSGILVGGDAIQISLGLPAATVQVFNGMLLVFLIAGEYFLRHRIVITRKGVP